MMNSGRRATPFDLADARGWNKSCPTLLCSSLKEIITRIDYRSCRAQYQRDPEKWVNCLREGGASMNDVVTTRSWVSCPFGEISVSRCDDRIGRCERIDGIEGLEGSRPQAC